MTKRKKTPPKRTTRRNSTTQEEEKVAPPTRRARETTPVPEEEGNTTLPPNEKATWLPLGGTAFFPILLGGAALPCGRSCFERCSFPTLLRCVDAFTSCVVLPPPRCFWVVHPSSPWWNCFVPPRSVTKIQRNCWRLCTTTVKENCAQVQCERNTGCRQQQNN